MDIEDLGLTYLDEIDMLNFKQALEEGKGKITT